MDDRKSQGTTDRTGEATRDDAADPDRLDHKDFDAQPGDGRMSGARTGRFGGAQDDPDEETPGFTPEGRSGT